MCEAYTVYAIKQIIWRHLCDIRDYDRNDRWNNRRYDYDNMPIKFSLAKRRRYFSYYPFSVPHCPEPATLIQQHSDLFKSFSIRDKRRWSQRNCEKVIIFFDLISSPVQTLVRLNEMHNGERGRDSYLYRLNKDVFGLICKVVNISLESQTSPQTR